ncbi:MAG: tetratricopeptide repeat protein [Acidobacteriota bacterium]|nr:tetratricopeptide repeat protein [Acidobacteriota bacterium]
MRCRVVVEILSGLSLFALLCAAQNTKTSEALAAFQHGNLPAAEQLLRTELHANPNDTPALEILAIVLDQQKKYSEADALYRRALKLDPQSPALLNNFGNHLIASGHAQEARATFLRVLSINPDHTNACMQLAQLDLNRHSPAEAIGFLDRLSSSHGDSPSALALRGQAEMKLEQFAKAVQTWKHYLQLVPGDDAARRECAFAETALGSDTNSALQTLQSFVRNHPGDATGFYELGAAESSGSPRQAIEHLNRALALDPDLSAARLARGLLLYRQSKTVEALADFEMAAKRQPNDARVLDRLGQTYTALNRFNDAVPVLRKAAVITPNDPSILLHLGLALSKSGNPDESKAVFARMRKLETTSVSLRN